MKQLFPASSSQAFALSAQALTLSHDRHALLIEGLSLSVEPGEILTVLGPSGVGKSSLLRVLAGLAMPLRGTVHAGSERLVGTHPEVALMFQEPGLLPWLNLEQNVAFGLDFKRQKGIPKADRQQRVSEAIEAVGLSHARHLYPAALSGGMAQRAALARCVARRPKVILLDEPFGALDEVTRESMQSLLLRLCAQSGAAAVLITHDIDEALQVSDRIVLLAGRPAGIFGQWTLAHAQPRDALDPEFVRLRVEIVQCMRSAIKQDAHAGVTGSKAPSSWRESNLEKPARSGFANQELVNVH